MLPHVFTNSGRSRLNYWDLSPGGTMASCDVLMIGEAVELRDMAEVLQNEGLVAQVATQAHELANLDEVKLIVLGSTSGIDLQALCQQVVVPIIVLGARPQGAGWGDHVDFIAARFEPADLLSRIKLHLRLREARDQASRYRAITDAASDAVISADSEGNIRSWNSGATELFGYDEQEVQGKSLDLIIPDRYLDAHHRGMKRFLEIGRLTGESSPVTVSACAKDGRELHVELSLGAGSTSAGPFVVAIIRDLSKRDAAEQDMHKLQRAAEQSGASIVITISGLADADGHVTHFVAVKADITHSKWTQSRLETLGQELAVKQKNFVNIIERTTDAIIVLDDARSILFVNQAAGRLFILSAAEISSRGIDDIPLDAGETQARRRRDAGGVHPASIW